MSGTENRNISLLFQLKLFYGKPSFHIFYVLKVKIFGIDFLFSGINHLLVCLKDHHLKEDQVFLKMVFFIKLMKSTDFWHWFWISSHLSSFSMPQRPPTERGSRIFGKGIFYKTTEKYRFLYFCRYRIDKYISKKY